MRRERLGKEGGTNRGASWFLLQTLLGRRGGTVRLRQRHNAVRALQVRLQGLLIGGLQRLEQMLRLPAVVTVETPVAPAGEDEGKQRIT